MDQKRMPPSSLKIFIPVRSCIRLQEPVVQGPVLQALAHYFCQHSWTSLGLAVLLGLCSSPFSVLIGLNVSPQTINATVEGARLLQDPKSLAGAFVETSIEIKDIHQEVAEIFSSQWAASFLPVTITGDTFNHALEVCDP
jgi:hypothetical protein